MAQIQRTEIGAMSNIKFEEEGHRYLLDGVQIPSVTQIMKPMSLMVYENIGQSTLMQAADKGTRAHEQISNHIIYDILETDEDTKPYVEAFLKWESAYKPVFIASERLLYHRMMRYAGTCDILAFVTPDDGKGVDIIDIKTTSTLHHNMLAVQLGAYAEALKSESFNVRDLYGLQLLSDGSYRFEKVENDYKSFLCCLQIYNKMKG